MDVSNHTQSTGSRSNSRTSSNSELEKEIIELEISRGTKKSISTSNIISNNNNINNNNNSSSSLNNSLTNSIGNGMSNADKVNTLKKRISSGKTPTRKAKRVRFYRNGDKFYTGILIPVSNERYKWVFFIWFLIEPGLKLCYRIWNLKIDI
jgi:doublecortin-like kinase 1/2